MREGTLTDGGLYPTMHGGPPPGGFGKLEVEYVDGWNEWGCKRHRFKWRFINGTYVEYHRFATYFLSKIFSAL